MDKKSIERTYAKTLLELGIRPNIKGYYYLLEGLTRVHTEPEIVYSMMKKFYTLLAESQDNANIQQVERAIRHAISIAENASTPLWCKLFSDGQRPSNSLFLAMIRETIRLKLREEGDKVG